MTKPLRLLFDECLGKPIVHALADFLEKSDEVVEVKHILDFQAEGVPDADWIPKVASEGWVVITADRGQRGRAEAGGTLPRLCKAFGITHVLLSAAIHRWRSFDKAIALTHVWPEILALRDAPPGSCYSLRQSGRGHIRLVRLDHLEEKSSE